MAFWRIPSSDLAAHEHARQQQPGVIGENGAQRYRAGALIHRDFGKLQLARLIIGGAIFQDQLDHRLIGARRLQLPAGQFALQPQQRGAGLNDVHINRVQLRDRDQQRGLVGRDQRALGHRRPAGPPGDRRDDFGITKIDFGAADRRLSGGDIRLPLLQAAHRIVQILLADGVGLGKRAVAVDRGLRGFHHRLIVLQSRLRAGKRGLIGRGIDLVQQLPGLDLITFDEGPLEDHASNLRPHLGHAEGRGAPRQVGRQRHGFGMQRHHLHFRRRWRRWRGRRGLCLVLTAGKDAGQQQHQGESQRRDRLQRRGGAEMRKGHASLLR